ncbi:MAG: hypothetical protein SVY53_02140 [Chloroflexota bacterium]|nr:hypothetical protein [Chloroflexota bacterium]
MGGSYDWMAWIFDQYTVRVEKDAVLALFDRTNVFTMDRAIETLQYPLARGQDLSQSYERHVETARRHRKWPF